MEPQTPITYEYKGKSYRLPPLTLVDLIEHAKVLRDDHISEAKRQMVGLPLDLAKHAYDTARAEADKIQLGTIEYKKAAWEYSALIRAFYLAALKTDKDFALATVQEIFNNDSIKASEVALELLGFFVGKGETTTPPQT